MVRRRMNSRPSTTNRSTSKAPARQQTPTRSAATQRVQQSGGTKPAAQAGGAAQQGARPQQAAPATSQQPATKPQSASQQPSQQAAKPEQATAQQATAARAAEGAGAKQPQQAANPAATPQDQASVSAEAKEGARPGESSGVSDMMNKFGDWAKGQYESAKGVVKEGVQTAKDIAEFGPTMMDIQQNGITPKNMDKVNDLLKKVDTPEAAAKFLKEHPFMADKLRGLGEDKLNAMFNKTDENMKDTTTLYKMLGPNRLGGKDGSVTTGDTNAITSAAMRDGGMRDMFMQAASSKAFATGHRVAGRVMGRQGPIANLALNKLGHEMVSGQLNGALNKVGLRGAQDNTPRRINYGELDEMVKAGQRLGGNSQPQSLNSMVQQGIWNPKPSPTMDTLKDKGREGGQQVLNNLGVVGKTPMAQDIMQKTVNSIPQWLQGNQQEGVRKYWEANMHINNLLQSVGVDGR